MFWLFAAVLQTECGCMPTEGNTSYHNTHIKYHEC